jgi:ribonucleoside-diphosphate reductase alpha chain
VFAPAYRRTVLKAAGAQREFLLHDYAVRLWREQSGRSDAIPDALVTAATLPIEAHLAMQAALQVFIDNSISKTINVPAETAFSDFAPIYRLAYDKGLKGCTTFRPTAARDTVLTEKHKAEPPCPSPGGCE